MANPSIPVVASFPIPPPLPNLPISGQDGLPTPYFFQFMQFLWSAIQGSGGIIEQTTDVLLNRDNTLSTSQAFIGKSPDLTHMPYAPVVQGQILQISQTIASLLGRISSLESLVLLGLTSRTILISQLDGPYTVAMLPAVSSTGKMAYVTDATLPTYLGALVGGGGVMTPVVFNGAAWVSF